MAKFSFLTAVFLLVFSLSFAQHNHKGHDHSGHDHSGHDHSGHDHSGHNHGKKKKTGIVTSKKLQNERGGKSHAGHDHTHTNSCGIAMDNHSTFNAGKVAFHHISDQNIYSIGPWHFPLPCITKDEDGWHFFSSGKFKADHHGNAHYAYDGYTLYEGSLRKIVIKQIIKVQPIWACLEEELVRSTISLSLRM